MESSKKLFQRGCKINCRCRFRSQRIVATGRGIFAESVDVRFFTMGTCFFAATILFKVSITMSN